MHFKFNDPVRNRIVPVILYLPDNITNKLPAVVFNPGFQGQENLKEDGYYYDRYDYLAQYFTSNQYAFISIQHDIIGDDDGLETVDPNAVQNDARRHLYIRGEANILFAIKQLEQQNLQISFDKFILSGHSNGGDIAKYFVNQHPDLVSSLILFDARRARLKPLLPLSVLMFEADDTTTDALVIPEPSEDLARSKLNLIIIKPSGALHESYLGDCMTENLKAKIYSALNYFFNFQ